MQVFKAFFKTAKKSLPMNIIYFVIFCTIALTLSGTYADSDQPAFSSVALEIAVIDEDKTEASAALKDYLSGVHHLTETANDKNALLDRLFYRNVSYILILPEGFEQKLVSGEAKLFETVQIPGVYNSAFVDSQLNTYLNTVRLYLTGGFPLHDALNRTVDSLSETKEQITALAPKDTEASSMKGIFFYFQFLPYVILSMILCGITPILTTFWEKNLAKRISCSSASLLNQNLQLALGSALYCLIIWCLFILAARIFYGPGQFGTQGLLCIANSFLLLPIGVAISLIISCFHPPANTINMFNNIITLGMSFLCGIFVPQQQLGENVLAVSRFLPFYWYIKNNNLIAGFSGGQFDRAAYRTGLGIQLLFIIALFAAALVISKYRRKAP